MQLKRNFKGLEIIIENMYRPAIIRGSIGRWIVTGHCGQSVADKWRISYAEIAFSGGSEKLRFHCKAQKYDLVFGRVTYHAKEKGYRIRLTNRSSA